MFPTLGMCLAGWYLLTCQTSAACWYRNTILLHVSSLCSVFNTGLLPPARARKDWWPPHAVAYLWNYECLRFKQFHCSHSGHGILTGQLLGFTVREVPSKIVVRIWCLELVTGSNHLDYTSSNYNFDHAYPFNQEEDSFRNGICCGDDVLVFRNPTDFTQKVCSGYIVRPNIQCTHHQLALCLRGLLGHMLCECGNTSTTHSQDDKKDQQAEG